MIETDLDRRLRAALAHPAEPAASTAQLAALRAELPGRRSRRRSALAASAAAAGVAAALILALGGNGAPPQRAAVGHGTASAGPSCVEVAVGTAALRCIAQVNPTAPSAAALSTNGPALAAPQPAFGLEAGRNVTVSMPKLAGVTWRTVTVTPAGTSAPVGRHVRVHVDGDGRSVADIGPLGPGRYTLSATAERRCGAGPGCVSGAVGWSTVVTVP